MEEQLISFETAKLAKEKGFNLETYIKLDEDNPKNLNSNYNPKEYQPWYLDISQSLLQKWLREVHNIHINIRYEEYFQKVQYKYYHFDISNGTLTDVTKQEDLFGNLMEECSQDIPGNHLNVEKFSELIFEKKFAFKTYEKALEEGLLQGLNLIK